MTSHDFQRDVRVYVLEMVEEGLDVDFLIKAFLNAMPVDDVKEMLDLNELSPRFLIPEEEED